MMNRLSIAVVAIAILLWYGPVYAERKLNNFVTEIANIPAPGTESHAFRLTQPSWVFVRATHPSAASVLSVNDQFRSHPREDASGRMLELMCYLPAGDHKAIVSEAAEVKELQIRRIAEIRFCKYPYNPWIYHFGAYDWKFLEKHILPNITTMVARYEKDYSALAKPWREQGRRWMIEIAAPGFHKHSEPVDAEYVYRELLASEIRQPWIDGALLDEFFPENSILFKPTNEGIARVMKEAAFAGKKLEPYIGGPPEQMAEFLQQTVKGGQFIAEERYNCEQPTRAKAEEYLSNRLAGMVQRYGKVLGEPAQKHLIITLGMMSGPPETLNTCPSTDYRVFQDMEFKLLATDPSLEGITGVMQYTCGYSEEETIRWVGKLFRHYCIEGATELLSKDPYELPHLQNADFQDGTNAWHLKPAEAGSIAHRKVPKLGDMQGRFGSGTAGDQCLVMTRSDKAPNSISQTLKGLTPGKLYALRTYTSNLRQIPGSNYGNPQFDDVIKLNIQIAGAEFDDAKCFDHIFRSIHTKDLIYFNYHFRLFRPTTVETKLTISDWRTADDQWGDSGGTTAINFIEVQPYLER